jgi:hypothetical protein
MVKRLDRRLLIILGVLASLAGAGFWTCCNVGQWLVVDDALQPTRAIAVLSGLIRYPTFNYIFAWAQGAVDPEGRTFSAGRWHR